MILETTVLHILAQETTRSRSNDRSSEGEYSSSRKKVSPTRKKARNYGDIDHESKHINSSFSRDVNNISNEKCELRTRDKNKLIDVTSTLSYVNDLGSKLGPLCLPIPHLLSQAKIDVSNDRDPMESFKSEDIILFNMILGKLSTLLNRENISIVEMTILREAENQLRGIVEALEKPNHGSGYI